MSLRSTKTQTVSTAGIYLAGKQALFDKSGRLHRYLDVYVNGESAYPEELVKPVKDGDNLQIVMIVAGG